MIANLTISILWLPIIILGAAFGGFLFRSAQIRKSKRRIINLENEMLRNHAEILQLQGEILAIEKNSGLAHKSRVVPMKESPPDENSGDGHKKKLKK